MESYDVLIIGGGLAGYYCAISCRKRGLTVAIVEKETLLGGTGIRTGALPVKKLLDTFKKNRKDKECVKTDIIKNLDSQVKLLCKKLEKDLRSNGVDIYFANGEFLDEHRYSLGEKILYGDYIVIATGTKPSSIEEIKIDGEIIITHKEGINLNNLPESIIILGGNVEGVEFANVYGNLGVEVIVVEKEEALLLGNDEDLVKPIESSLEKLQVNIVKGVGAKKAYIEDNKANIVLENGQILKADQALVTLDREPNFPKGIDKLNILKDEFKIKVDNNLRTNIDHIYAIGDINGILGMAHGAIQQGISVSEHISRKRPILMKYDSLPRAVFTMPEMAGAGYQENELIEKGINYIKGYSYFSDTWRGWSKGIEEGFLKVLLDKDGRVLGIWMVGDDVSEYIGPLGLLLEKNITADDIKNNLIIHPSLWESLLDAILNIEY